MDNNSQLQGILLNSTEAMKSLQRVLQFREGKGCPGFKLCLLCALRQNSLYVPYLKNEDNTAYFSQPFSGLIGTYKMSSSI